MKPLTALVLLLCLTECGINHEPAVTITGYVRAQNWDSCEFTMEFPDGSVKRIQTDCSSRALWSGMHAEITMQLEDGMNGCGCYRFLGVKRLP